MSPPDEVLKLDVSINGRNANTVINDSKKLQLDMLNKMVAEKNKDYNPKQGGTFYFLVDPSQSHTINGDNVKIETSYSISSTFKFVKIPMDRSTISAKPVEDISFAQAFPASKPVTEVVKSEQSLQTKETQKNDLVNFEQMYKDKTTIVGDDGTSSSMNTEELTKNGKTEFKQTFVNTDASGKTTTSTTVNKNGRETNVIEIKTRTSYNRYDLSDKKPQLFIGNTLAEKYDYWKRAQTRKHWRKENNKKFDEMNKAAEKAAGL
jgi:hypothetical protein